MRTCKVCHTAQPVESFPVTNTNKQTGKRYYAWTCKDCRSDLRLPEGARKVRKQNREFSRLMRWPAPGAA